MSSDSDAEGLIDGIFDHEESSSWRVELGGDTSLWNLAKDLQKNTLATDVDVCVHDSMAQLSSVPLISFFDNMSRSLEGLRRLEFYPGAGSYNSLPIECLLAALRGGDRLEILYVYHLELHGDISMFQSLARQLEKCQALNEVCFIDCRMSSNQDEYQLAFDPIVSSLGRLESLQVVALWADDLGGVTDETLVELFRSSSIERLMLLGFDVSDQAVSAVFRELEWNQSLRRLNLSCRIGTNGCRSLSQMLQQNSSLERLQIDFDALENESDLVLVARGLQDNSTLNYLKLAGPGVREPSTENCNVQEAFESMMECNLSLESLSILDRSVHSDKMDLYLKLNNCGRRAVLQAAGIAEKDAWLDALVNANGDVDCLFYFLSNTDHVALVVDTK